MVVIATLPDNFYTKSERTVRKYGKQFVLDNVKARLNGRPFTLSHFHNMALSERLTLQQVNVLADQIIYFNYPRVRKLVN